MNGSSENPPDPPERSAPAAGAIKATNRPEPVLNDRAQHLFKLLVERYIQDGKPVGSRALSKDSSLDLSAATVRNVMADLEDLGLLWSPHTSAGRVPTVSGYRLFVDTLLTVSPLGSDEIEWLEGQLGPDQEPSQIVTAASSILSEVTRLAGVVTLPKQEVVRLRHVEFLSLSEERVLVIMVVNESEVQNRIIRTARRYSQAELQQAASQINAWFVGEDLNQARRKLLDELRSHRDSMTQMMAAAVEVAEKAFEPGAEDARSADGVLVAGQTNLMGYGELGDMRRLRDLFDAFSRKRDVLLLLDQALNTAGVQIFIGDEAGYDAFDTCSVVSAPYEIDGQVVGVLGVIGPTRMAYDRVIPIVEVTARLLGAALKTQH